MEFENIINKLTSISGCYDCEILNRDDVVAFVNEVRNVLFLGYFEKVDTDVKKYLNNKLKSIKINLEKILYCVDSNKDNEDVTKKFIDKLVDLKSKLNLDVNAFLESDPAVESEEEIILSYPGFYAISLYRIANLLVELNVSSIPRIISEHAHSKTGIDIHPKANIGESFFIDHGTGVVIGETSIIGDKVKIYQGVTLGALSLSNIDELKNVKRHPTILNNVTIYSGASILGGSTVIGKNSVIGSNVFITKSIDDNSKVIFTNYDQLHKIKEI